MRRCPRRGGRYRACQLASHFLFVCFVILCGLLGGLKLGFATSRVVFAFWKVEDF